MKKVTLKPVTVPLPRSAPTEVLMSVAKAEAAIRENNQIIENVLNTLLKDKENNYGESDTD